MFYIQVESLLNDGTRPLSIIIFVIVLVLTQCIPNVGLHSRDFVSLSEYSYTLFGILDMILIPLQKESFVFKSIMTSVPTGIMSPTYISFFFSFTLFCIKLEFLTVENGIFYFFFVCLSIYIVSSLREVRLVLSIIKDF